MKDEQTAIGAGRGRIAQLAVTPAAMRSDVASMLMPFFPDDRSLTTYTTTIDGYGVTISSDDGQAIATSNDRKILNFLAGAIARKLRAGEPPSRDVSIEVREMIAAINSEGGVPGGTDYQRIRERLGRLMATVIETDMPIGDGVRRRRRFRWIDAFEHDDQLTPGGRKIIAINISVSKDAFEWFTRTLGFDTSAHEFQRITSGRSSIWRIYEICLATIAQAKDRTVLIPISDLRDRVPIISELKVFKARTLKGAIEAINNSPEMASRITVRLERRTARGFEPVAEHKPSPDLTSEPAERQKTPRVPLTDFFVRVGPGKGAMPRFDRLIDIEPRSDEVSVPAPHPGPLLLDPPASDKPVQAMLPFVQDGGLSQAAPALQADTETSLPSLPTDAEADMT